MRSSGVLVAVWVVLGMHGIGHAQPQDDAALADDEKPKWTTSAATGPTSTSTRAESPEEDEAEAPLSTAELVKGYPDVKFRVVPPPRLAVYLNAIYPFQVLGLGLGLDVYALPRLRLSLTGTFGLSVSGESQGQTFAHPSAYGEAGVGLAVLRFAGQTNAKLPINSPRLRMTRDRSALPRRSETERFMFGDPELGDDQFVRAMVPAFHSVELEVGAFTGLYPLYRCTADCDKNPIIVPHTVEDASLQVTLFYAGIRYVYYRSASSEQVPFRSHAGFEAAIDAIHNPFTVRDAGLFNIYDGHPTHEPVGFRVKLSLPSLKCIANGPCLGVDLMGGYLPTPSDGMFSVNAVVQ